ncbi:response regulator [Pengzhenrongella sicca]|uniref:Transcriptional regulatory protein n=1 Tax=Pengzhenrongella sicca TaxID=2819238 RepID=A0A8A4ZJV4_9MICO|nr:response regulator [Pengzhenrongella sicca]QTE30817.1 response regulator [Pengzhenrongella sicca]
MIRVLVVDDQPIVADAHRVFIDRVPGFTAVGIAHDGAAALARVERGGVDLVLLDLAMPGMHGLDVCRALQTSAHAPDVMIVTASRDLETVRAAVRHGAVHYLIKPFTFAALRSKLDHYARYRAASAGRRDVTDQGEIDAVLAALRDPVGEPLPKGMSRETLDAVRTALVAAPEGLTAAHAAELIGASRVTVRRYLDNLVLSGACVREPQYGRAGRPTLSYRLRPPE